MGLEALLERLERDAEARVAAIEAEARSELDAIERARAAAAAARESESLERERALRRAAMERELSAARRRAAARVLEARSGAIERVFARAEAMLDGANADPAYRAVVSERARAALAFAEDGVVACRPDLAGALAGLAVREDPAIDAGFVIEAPGVVIDETLRGRLARSRDSLRIAIAAELDHGL